MKIQLNKIKEAFSPQRINFTLLVALAVCFFFIMRGCSKEKDLRAEAKRAKLINEQNIRAMTDSLHHTKTKLGELETFKSSYVSKLEDLEKLNADLFAEVKSEIGKVKSLIKSSVTIEQQPVTMSNSLVKYPDGNTFGLKFENTLNDTGLTWNIKGESKFKFENSTIFPGNTTISENKLNIGIIMGTKEDKNGNIVAYARSKSKRVTFDELESVLIIPKKPDILTPPVKNKKFGIGPNIGIGLGLNLKPTLFVGFGLNYNIIKF